MKFDQTTPCADCPFLVGTEHGYSDRRLQRFASGPFPCHKTARVVESKFVATRESRHCAGALLYQRKRGDYSQATRIAHRLGLFDPDALDTEASVR